ncbi:MAG: glycosyltransferase [Beijerinckiaceae bacterium]|nr:MAG: glycosyltransferase [Beijerinckiaceae bacterium]
MSSAFTEFLLSTGEAVIAHISARYQTMSGRLTKANPPWLKKWRAKIASSQGVTPQALATVRNSVFFDAEFYLAANPDVRAAGVDPALHYLLHGGFERRNPGPAFSTRQYLDCNPDVVALRMNALLHYELHGREEGRPAPCLDPALAARALDANFGKKPRNSLVRRIRETLNRVLPLPGVQGGKQSNDTSYSNWIRLYDTLSERDRHQIGSHIERFACRPLISVVMPAYETPEKILREAIASVQAQLYQNWELCIADDASPSPNVINVLKEMSASDPRIKWMRRESNGHISAASNSALDLASGEFVALMDHDDLLAEHALYEIVAELNEHPDADLIYSDEDHIDDEGRRHTPYFKTDWNPELFLGHNLISHLGVYRRSIIETVGRFRKGFEGSQDYDLALRVVSVTTPEKIRHIPSVLYHWRRGSEAASFSESQMQRCVAAARAAKANYLAGRGEIAEVLQNPLVPTWERVRRVMPSPAPLVSLIVPTRNRHDLLAPCLDGLLNRTDYRNIEILVIDHQSDDSHTLELLAHLRDDKRVRIIRYEGAFNYSDMNNKAVAQAHGEIVGLINNDVDVIDRGWLTEMVSFAIHPENGAVGAKLLYPDGRIQHAGVVLGMGSVAGHLHVNAAREAVGYFGRLALTSNVSAVTGACLIVRKAVFQEAGGLNAVDLPVAFNDVDLCLKIQARGYRNVWTPFALLYHHESLSRGSDTTPEKVARVQREADYLRSKWGHLLDHDPYFSPNLSLQTPTFDLAFPPRRIKPWHRSQKSRSS